MLLVPRVVCQTIRSVSSVTRRLLSSSSDCVGDVFQSLLRGVFEVEECWRQKTSMAHPLAIVSKVVHISSPLGTAELFNYSESCTGPFILFSTHTHTHAHTRTHTRTHTNAHTHIHKSRMKKPITDRGLVT